MNAILTKVAAVVPTAIDAVVLMWHGRLAHVAYLAVGTPVFWTRGLSGMGILPVAFKDHRSSLIARPRISTGGTPVPL